MAKEEVKLFFEEASKNENLRKDLAKAEENLTSLNKTEIKTFFDEKLIPVINKYGFDFSYQDILDFKENLTQKGAEELSDDFLAQAAGGTFCLGFGGGDRCGCFLGGGGSHEKDCNYSGDGKVTCICVLGGGS